MTHSSPACWQSKLGTDLRSWPAASCFSLIELRAPGRLKLKLCLPATPTGTKCTLMTEQQFARESVDVTSRLDMPTLDVVEQLQSACAAAGAESVSASREPPSMVEAIVRQGGCYGELTTRSHHPIAYTKAASLLQRQTKWLPPWDPPNHPLTRGRAGVRGSVLEAHSPHAHVPHLITSHDIPVPPKPL
jgi:hypothetical protein